MSSTVGGSSLRFKQTGAGGADVKFKGAGGLISSNQMQMIKPAKSVMSAVIEQAVGAGGTTFSSYAKKDSINSAGGSGGYSSAAKSGLRT
jgi:hypothetical protein